ncbi:MAG: transglycosylase SLT domain-containing protein [Kosmotogaceae bacterium]|nr:transglycosylase SLT domain-containing protein [Kosmotogaceae bacterium]
MDKGKKIDMIVLSILLVSIIFFLLILTSLSAKNRLERVAALSVLYNAGLGADYKAILENPSYQYDDRVIEAYEYFTDKSGSLSYRLNGSVKMHNVLENDLFISSQTISDLSQQNAKRERPDVENKIALLIESSSSLSDRSAIFKNRLSEEIYNALMEFENVKVDIIVGSEIKTLDLSSLDPEVVLAIMVVESSLNPFALMEERSIDESFSEYVYSRGLMQIYEMTLWTLNSWLKQSKINIKPQELWSVRNNIFLGMVYLAYANEFLEEKR